MGRGGERLKNYHFRGYTSVIHDTESPSSDRTSKVIDPLLALYTGLGQHCTLLLSMIRRVASLLVFYHVWSLSPSS